VPEHLRDGRFGNWLENARDWAISRNRFWGTPLPVWKNAEGESVCIGSVDELERLSGVRVDDLHLETVAHLQIPSQRGGAPLTHVGSVLDCWFESGSMPYAERGYPFENREELERRYPADFIAEGLDQTRGWFYTLMVIGVALSGRAPFKNVVVNGLILAEDGKKMSKSLRNYPDPLKILEEHGADALRLYLINSPAVKAQELRFSEKDVRDVARRILLRWWNAYSFFVNYANIDRFVPRGDYRESPNILDRWVVSRLHSLIRNTNLEMSAYRLYNVVPGLLQFVEELTNTYVRANRQHFWRDGMPEDKRLAFETLSYVLATFARLMAPFTPFLSESIYQNLAKVAPGAQQSVHLTPYPEADETLRDESLEAAVARMAQVLVLGRNLRENLGIKAKIPLNRMRLIHRDRAVLQALEPFEPYVKDELNVRELVYEPNEDAYIQISAKASFARLGKRLGKRMNQVAAAIAALSLDQILALEAGATLEIAGEPLGLEDIEVRRQPKQACETLAVHQIVSVELDPTVTEAQLIEGLSREVIRRVNIARKEARLRLDDRIHLQLSCSPELRRAVDCHRERVMAETLALTVELVDGISATFASVADIDGERLELGFSPA
jgi:isoleucyl-tRNA synthetase